MAALVSTDWPDAIDPTDLASPALWSTIETARRTLLESLDLGELA
jgi:succinylarginine dihydrolase